MGSTLSGMMSGIVEEKPKVNEDTQAYLDRMSQNYFVCDGCGYIGKGDAPVTCPVCGAEGDRFKLVDKSIFEAAAQAEGTLETDIAYDDVPMHGPRMRRKRSGPFRPDSNAGAPKQRSRRAHGSWA